LTYWICFATFGEAHAVTSIPDAIDFSVILPATRPSFHYSSPGRRINLPGRDLLFKHGRCRDQILDEHIAKKLV
jgi:hypothetical protein